MLLLRRNGSRRLVARPARFDELDIDRAAFLEESQDNPLYHVEADRTSVVTAGSGPRNVLADSTLGPRERGRGDEAA